MKKRIPIGIEFYKEMIDKDYYYIDKTLLIKEILDSGAKVSLLTRPRRFGKTLAVTMLKDFFEDERDSNGNKIDNSCYFKEKKISDCGDVYLSKQGRYPIINLTLKSANQPDYEMIYGVLKKSIIEEFGRHFYIFQGQMLREDEIQKFQEILKGEAKPDDYVATLVFLSQCLKKYHNSNVVILIDEYGVFCDYNNTEKRKKPFFNKICSKGGFFMRRPVQWNYAAGAAHGSRGEQEKKRSPAR